MPLETATYISDLNPANPAHSDQLSQADSHPRLIKSALKATFPNFTAAALNATQALIDAAVAAYTAGTNVFASGSVPTPGIAFKDDLDTGFSNPAANTIKGSVGGVEFMAVGSDKSVTLAGNLSAPTYTGGTGQLVPAGVVLDFAGSAAPTGYLMCFGQAVSRTTYSALFSAIGIAHGAGDGSTTFNLPDARGRVSAGKDDMGGAAAGRLSTQVTGTTLGASGGAETHTLVASETPSHQHDAFIDDPGHAHDVKYSLANIQSGTGKQMVDNIATAGNVTGTNAALTKTTGVRVKSSSGGAADDKTSSVGGDGAHTNVQPTIVFNKIIKT